MRLGSDAQAIGSRGVGNQFDGFGIANEGAVEREDLSPVRVQAGDGNVYAALFHRHARVLARAQLQPILVGLAVGQNAGDARFRLEELRLNASGDADAREQRQAEPLPTDSRYAAAERIVHSPLYNEAAAGN